MTEALKAAVATAVAEVAAIPDLVERYQAARSTRGQLSEGDRALKLVQQEIARLLKPGKTWAEVGKILGVTGSRAEQIAKGR
ncbi:hypothetical protein [Streptomyces syringium]|uniref:hypothetical protein n=1 Tax=Streptomyces syringium TaxID=76729 RepID=UPI003AAB3C5A